MNIPEIKLGIIAVSRDCFPISLSTKRRQSIVAEYGEGLYECPITVENEKDALAALDDVKSHDVNALVVFLGNFGPETPETLLCQKFDGPTMYIAAAEGDGDLINGRGDAYCGVLNCSYNLGMRHLKAYIPEYPVGMCQYDSRVCPHCPCHCRREKSENYHLWPTAAGFLCLQRSHQGIV